MNNQKRLDGKFKLVRLTAALEKDMRAFCKMHKIKSESGMVREAIAAYIYDNGKTNTTVNQADMDALGIKIEKLINIMDRVFNV